MGFYIVSLSQSTQSILKMLRNLRYLLFGVTKFFIYSYSAIGLRYPLTLQFYSLVLITCKCSAAASDRKFFCFKCLIKPFIVVT